MARRAVDLCEPEFLEAELNCTYRTFEENGYPSSLVLSVIQQTLTNPHGIQRSTFSRPRVLLPYRKGLIERIQMLLRILHFSACYKQGPNLHPLLRSDKLRPPLDETTGVACEVKCSCSATHIGETGFTPTHRFVQHMTHLTHYNSAKQALEETTPRQTNIAPALIAIEHPLAASAVAEHAVHCSGTVQIRLLQ
ncbi:hypothetical protein M513_11870 [Trichuris suis]|uniref:Helix-turn-helix domain-containing protein n=1 Tax=Trichuris suis TaxID=68888 RepID=A0A085LQM4_9BILA|nr:hypothetical protein M513_11870 [Trichuris suis]